MSKEILFKSLSYKNFMSVGENGITIQLDRHPTTLVCGHNGAGKSIILEALTFVLFNKSYRGINKPGLINSVNQKDCVVEVVFQKGPDVYTVTRGISPAKFIIEKNDKPIDSEAASRDTQKYLETVILGADFKTFSQLVIVGAASYTPFMKLTASQRRDMVETVLDIGVFSNMNKVLKSKINAWKQEYARIESEISSSHREITLLEDFISKSNTQTEDYIKKKNEQLKALLDEIKQLSDTLDSKIDTGQTKDKLVKIRERRAELDRKMSSLNTEHRGHQKTYAFFEQNDHCPTCDQEIELEHKRNKMNEIGEVADAIKEEADQIESKLKTAKKYIGEFESKISDADSHNRRVDMAESRISSLKRNAVALKKEISEYKEETVDTSSEETKLARVEGKIATLLDDKKRLDADKIKYDRALKLLKDDGIKAKIIKKYIPILNQYVNKYLRILNFNVTFELDESFNENLKTRYKNEFKYANFSMGERQRLDLALMFAWLNVARTKNSLSTNLLILDEVEGHLDKAGADDVLGISEHIGEDMNVFIISHKTEIEDRVRSVLRLEKQNGFTKIA